MVRAGLAEEDDTATHTDARGEHRTPSLQIDGLLRHPRTAPPDRPRGFVKTALQVTHGVQPTLEGRFYASETLMQQLESHQAQRSVKQEQGNPADLPSSSTFAAWMKRLGLDTISGRRWMDDLQRTYNVNNPLDLKKLTETQLRELGADSTSRKRLRWALEGLEEL